MFKKVFQTFAARFTQREETGSAPRRSPGKAASLLDKISSAVGKVQSKSAEPAASLKAKSKTPEEWCGVSHKMSKDDIKARLAVLYRRYNRATSSLDPKLRAEAEIMLDAVVAVREKTFGPI